jgi:hypothetical protein
MEMIKTATVKLNEVSYSVFARFTSRRSSRRRRGI